ncbi:MAG: elongation factor G [Candidatus Rokubacteria bacterium]|nr:elongation factor G [Candidatus Rokubacteria bacterium]
MTIEIGKIRNVAVIGHGGVGKPSLVEALLFAAGAVTRLGRVDDGTTTTDFDPDEIKRKISISTSLAYCDWKGHRINLVDTPGYGDFIADSRAGLRVVEAAVVVVDAVAGVQVQTEKVWKFATEFNLPRAVVVNRLDRERADFFRTLESLGRRLKGRVVPVQVPVGEEAGFAGFVDLVKMKAVTYADGKPQEGEIPAAAVDRAQEWREKLVEAAAETDDELLSRYLDEGSLDDAEMLTALRLGIAQGKIIPVLCACATKGIGAAPLLDLFVHEFPSPADRGELSGTDAKTKQPGTRAADAKAPVTALVFKTLSDPHAGKLSLFRVFSGTLRSESQLVNVSRGAKERMSHVSWLQGKTQKAVEALGPGEIGVVAKLKETLTGDTLADEAHPFELPRITFPEPAISFAIQPKTRGDEDKISTALARIAEEDPTVHYHFDPETKQLLVSGVGNLHVEMVVERMKRKYNADVSLLPPRIPYKETVKGRAEGQGKYKKQTGGRGQYGDTWLRVEPLPRGGGFEFVDDIFGGAVPRNYIPAVEKGVRDAMKRGVIAGYPVVDVQVTLYDGSYHEVDSSDLAFQIAGSLALQ